VRGQLPTVFFVADARGYVWGNEMMEEEETEEE
jgi:hypothetical protein